MHRGIERDLELLREYSQKPDPSRLDIVRSAVARPRFVCTVRSATRMFAPVTQTATPRLPKNSSWSC